MKGPELDAARRLLNQLKAKDPEKLFHVPIDTNAVADYLDVVSRPVDLGTIGDRLSETDLESFVEDVRLVFKNSIAYCSGKPQLKSILAKAKKLSNFVEQEIKKSLSALLEASRTTPAMRSAMSAAVTRLKKHKYGKIFTEPIDLSFLTDYEARVDKVVDLAKLCEAAETADVHSWILDLRRIGANCVRYNTFPKDEFRAAGVSFAVSVEKEIDSKLRGLFGGQGSGAQPPPKLLPSWTKILKRIEAAFQFEEMSGKAQKAFPFFHPIASYYDSPEPIRDYLRYVSHPISVGEIVAKLMQAEYQSFDQVDRDVKRIFSNCRTYFGPSGGGHASEGAAYFCELCDEFETNWNDQDANLKGGKSVELAGKKVGLNNHVASPPLPLEEADRVADASLHVDDHPANDTGESPTNGGEPLDKKQLDTAMRTILAALKNHKMEDGYSTAAHFASPVMLPENRGEYYAAIGGSERVTDLATIEKTMKQGGYATLDAFTADVQQCFDNARLWKVKLEEYSKEEGLLASKGLHLAVVQQARESCDHASILQALLKEKLHSGVDGIVAAGKRSNDDDNIQANGKKRKLATTAVSAKSPPANGTAKAPIRAKSPVRGKKSGKGRGSTVAMVEGDDGTPAGIDTGGIEDGADDGQAEEGYGDGVAAATSGEKKGLMVPWRVAVGKVYSKLSRHEWVKPDGEFGRKVMWHAPAVEAFPSIKDAYLSKIKKPIDLGLIRGRLHSYATPESFAADVVLVFENAVTYNEDAKKLPQPPGEVDFAVKIYDVAAHLRDWSRHLAIECLTDQSDMRSAGNPKRGDYVCAITASELRVGREKDELEARKAKKAEADADLTSEALEQFVRKTAEAAPAESEMKGQEATGEKKKLQEDFKLTPQQRLEYRRKRDEVVWPSRLGYNREAARDARSVLRALRKQQLRKFSQWFESPVVGFPDYAQFVAEPTCLEDIETRLNASTAERKAGQRVEIDPYDTMSDFASEVRRIFTNATAYNGVFREKPGTSGYYVMKAVETLVPVLEDALFVLALDSYERIGREQIVNYWTKSKVALINEQAKEKQKLNNETRREIEQQYVQKVEEQRISTKKDRERTLRKIMRLAVESLDIAPETISGDASSTETKDVLAPVPIKVRTSSIGGFVASRRDAAHLLVDDERERDIREARNSVCDAIANAIFASQPELSLMQDVEMEAPQSSRSPSNEEEKDSSRTHPLFKPFKLLTRRPTPAARDGQAGRRLLFLRQKTFGALAVKHEALDSGELREGRESKRRRLLPPPSPEEDARNSTEAAEPPQEEAVDASSGDTDWFTISKSDARDLEARIFVSSIGAVGEATFVRCHIVLRRVGKGPVCDDRDIVSFCKNEDGIFPSLVDALIEARATRRQDQFLHGIGGIDRLAIVQPVVDDIVIELASLPYSPAADTIVATPPLPSRRAGAVRMDLFIIQTVFAGTSRAIFIGAHRFAEALCRWKAYVPQFWFADLTCLFLGILHDGLCCC